MAWNWCDATGRLKDFAARSFLLKLQDRGLIELPALRKACTATHPQLRLVDGLPAAQALSSKFSELGAVSLEVVQPGTPSAHRWAYYITHHHYLGLRVVGQIIGYLASDSSGREVAALLFGAPAWHCAPRDAYLQARGFFPGVKVPHLASHVLGLAARRIVVDWHRKYGMPLQWLETFVNRKHFAVTCYRAANWVCVGATKGRGCQDRDHTSQVSEKDIYLYRLKR